MPPGAGGPQDVKLSEEEQKLVAKLLSDPTYFPLEFRTWLKNYIEGAGIMVSTSQVRGSGSVGARTGLPAGIVIICAGTGAVPPDAKVCDGAAYLRSVENELFAKIGVSWGVGDGSTTFNVPDLRDRSLFGAGAVIGVAQTDGHPFGSRSGWRHGHSFNLSVGVPQGSVQAAKGPDQPYDAVALNTVPTAVGGSIGTGNQDGPTWAGVILAITNGKAA